MCGGFTCSKNALISLNILYVLVSFILIGVAAYGKAASVVQSMGIVAGIIACGVFLLILSVLGLIGAIRHHQVTLFFYMVILFLLFIVQFGIAIGCLAIDKDQQLELAKKGWDDSSNSTRADAQNWFHCCGYSKNDTDHPSCFKVPGCCEGVDNEEDCCNGDESICYCQGCEDKVISGLDRGLQLSGGLGLFFCFTEFIGVWLTARYRNQKNPQANPGAFL